jgi:hypothetical protein
MVTQEIIIGHRKVSMLHNHGIDISIKLICFQENKIGLETPHSTCRYKSIPH